VLVFAGLSGALVLGLALGLTLVFPTEPDRRAVAVSAVVAWGVQLGAFALLWHFRGRHLLAAWSAGTAMRLVALGVCGLFVVRSWALPPGAALCSLGLFFFVSILLEPWLLRS
jgi:hypothetical protein